MRVWYLTYVGCGYQVELPRHGVLCQLEATRGRHGGYVRGVQGSGVYGMRKPIGCSLTQPQGRVDGVPGLEPGVRRGAIVPVRVHTSTIVSTW